MKNLIMFFVIFFILAVTLTAQDKKWGTWQEAKEFYELNIVTINDNIYEPSNVKGFKKTGVGEEIKTFQYYVTVKMDIVGGTFWVIQEPGTEFVVRGNKVVRLYECGNRISGFYSLESSSLPMKSLAFKCEKDDKGNRDYYTPIISKDCDDNCDGNIAIYKYSATILGAGIGAAIGGFGFKTTEVTTDVKVVPGVRLQTGDGTIIFGPNKIIVTKSSKRRFNTGAAIGWSIGCAVLSYLLWEFVL